ncbi:hypothetical protein FA95DRAFT_893640 [Auriscalpium vulgare]|uniref:Uncharacterized protein n=1 Tax=Auriscalpium vulgare TaxID=40419 RepID=A0ACB8S0F6_9AGAM|nr:hypothetical protein FA95DRAFT_893640 [Auriscalpium vulgare]
MHPGQARGSPWTTPGPPQYPRARDCHARTLRVARARAYPALPSLLPRYTASCWHGDTRPLAWEPARREAHRGRRGTGRHARPGDAEKGRRADASIQSRGPIFCGARQLFCVRSAEVSSAVRAGVDLPMPPATSVAFRVLAWRARLPTAETWLRMWSCRVATATAVVIETAEAASCERADEGGRGDRRWPRSILRQCRAGGSSESFPTAIDFDRSSLRRAPTSTIPDADQRSVERFASVEPRCPFDAGLQHIAGA